MIAKNGSFLGPSGLTNHLEAGGCASVTKLQKYFRKRDGHLEQLRDGEVYWQRAGWSIIELAREFSCMACDEPGVPDSEFPLSREAADVLYDNGFVVACDVRDASKWRLTGERHNYRKVK